MALVVALAGVLLALAGGVGGALDPIGIALALAAAVIYASYVLVSDRLLGTTEPLRARNDALRGRCDRVCARRRGNRVARRRACLSRTLLLIAAIALVATVLPIAAFLGGVRRLGPSRATILGTVEPPLTIGLSAVVFGERLTPGPAPRCGARGLGRRDRPGPGADEATAGSRRGAGTRAGARARAPRGLARARDGVYEKPWTFGHYAVARTEPR